MMPEITSHQIPGRNGWQVMVRLNISREEHVLIYEHRMLNIEIAKHKDRMLTLDDFYGGKHTTLWEIDSAHQVRLFKDYLEKGFRQLNSFIVSNRTHPDYKTAPPPFNFFDASRFEHTWLKGGSGWGKTSLLSALIDEDLKKVRDGTASVLIIDSQDEHLGRFLPELPLGLPLIYLEPDLDHPLALNILDVKGYDQLSKNERFEKLQIARDMLMFFIGATVGVPSGHMKNIIGFALRALALMERPTMFTFKELLVKGRLQNLQKEHPRLKELDDAAKKFLLTDLFNTNYAPSVQALASRLDAFDENEFLQACFSQPDNRFDLFEILKEPHLIVINLNKRLLREHISILGRYFLALVLGVVNTRTSGGLPCYVYVDEAHVLIKDEDVVEQLIATARRQKIALTFSHQWVSQVGETAKALQHCGVQINTGKKKYSWAVQVNQGEVVQIEPPFVDFSKIGGMPRAEWRAVLDNMHERFSVRTKTHKKSTDEMPDAI